MTFSLSVKIFKVLIETTDEIMKWIGRVLS